VPLTRGAFRIFEIIRPFIIAPVARGSRSGSMGMASNGNGHSNGHGSSNGSGGSPTNGGSIGGPGAHDYDGHDHSADEYDIHRINARRAQS
jgi:hypothetical protein